MNFFRRFGFAVWLALAVVVGQQAVLLHDLGHAVERMADGTGKQLPAEKKCDTHFTCSQLGSAVGSSAPVFAVAESGSVEVSSFVTAEASQRTRLAYRAQAPPRSLVVPA
ncbi:hypothetical protein BWI17_10335 [Betaproteobacteria bacterium GR16-43]|nr:hypothetical protein BWI17_10335 [Betaproteobacteria bacterium GR16-43]